MMFKRRGRPPHPDVLTPREWQVLGLLREGLTNAQIAERLDIAAETAKYHVAEILSKLHVRSREEAALWAPEAVRGSGRPGLVALVFGVKAAVVSGSAAALAGLGIIGYGVAISGGDPPGTAPQVEAQQERLTIKEAMKLAEETGELNVLTDRPEFGPDFRQTTLSGALASFPFSELDEVPPASGRESDHPVLVVHYGEFDEDARWFEKLCADLYVIVDEQTGELLASKYDSTPCPPPPEEGAGAARR